MKHAFSVELNSKEYLREVSISNAAPDHVLLEGFLGELEELSLVEGELMEVKGVNGVLRIDLNEDELSRILRKKEAD